MFNSIALLIVTVFYGVCLNKLLKRVKELERDVYCHMEGTHYPAIQNEFQTVWSAMEDMRENGED